GWKEIASYLKRGVRTVKRWEKGEGLPVRRHLHQARSSVYAYPSELDAWWATRQPRLQEAPPWRRPVPALALTAVLLLTLVTAGSGPILTPPGAAAAEPGSGMVARRILEAGEVPYGTVSPDGRYFTFVDWSTGDLAIRELATGEKRRLTDKGTWAESEEYAEQSIVSPDGQQVAYAWFNGQFYDLRVIGLDGSEPRVVYRNEDVEYLWPGAWSPDGKYVTATLAKADKANQIVLVSVADASARVLKTVDWRFPDTGPFSPDGRYIVYDFPPKEESPERDIFMLAADGSREIRLVKHPANDFALGWTLDGQRLLFASDRTGNTDVWAIHIADGNPQGNPRLVKPNIGRIFPLGFTREGAFYYGLATSLQDAYLAPLDLATGKGLGSARRLSQRFVGSTLWPQWSRDGKYLVYLQTDPQRYPRPLVLVIRSLESGEEQELRPELILGHQFYLRPALAPDGGSILLATQDKKGRQGIYRVDARTAAVTPVVRGEALTGAVLPAWSPDGKTVFYLERNRPDKRTTILARELASGQEKKLYEAAEPSIVHNFAVSHDGQQLAFLLGEQTTQSTALLVMPTMGGEPRELLRVQHPEFISWPTGVAWTPYGRYLLFRRGSEATKQPADLRRIPVGADLWRIPAAGGEPRKVGRTMPGFLLGLHVHPAGQRIVFTGGSGKAEVWVLENFLPELKAMTDDK
ncbi:MAG: hypothetical protein ACE5MH_06805, partial [Terriglobia bacterium]